MMGLKLEREPCVETSTNIGHSCANYIMEYMLDVEVRYAVDYGMTQEDGANARKILNDLLKKVMK